MKLLTFTGAFVLASIDHVAWASPEVYDLSSRCSQGLDAFVAAGPEVITNITCNDFGLSGTIPSEIATLTSLTLIDLQGNNLDGTIPSEIMELTKLTQLDISRNKLTGTIPDPSPAVALEQLLLFSNSLTGSIPDTIGTLTNLVELSLYENILTGPIPTEIGDISTLEKLELGNNQLSGSIPSEISNINKLQLMYLYQNNLDGTLPSELSTMHKLMVLSVDNNNIGGSIPTEYGEFSRLQQLGLYENMLTGTIPSELGNLDAEISLFPGNRFSGVIPDTIGFVCNKTGDHGRCEHTTESDVSTHYAFVGDKCRTEQEPEGNGTLLCTTGDDNCMDGVCCQRGCNGGCDAGTGACKTNVWLSDAGHTHPPMTNVLGLISTSFLAIGLIMFQ